MKKTILATTVAVAMGASMSVSAAPLFNYAGTFTFIDAAGVTQLTVDTDSDGTNDSKDTAVTGQFDLGLGTGAFTTTNTFSANIWQADVDQMFFYDTTAGGIQTFDFEWEEKKYTVLSSSSATSSSTVICNQGATLNGCAATQALGSLATYKAGGSRTMGYTFSLSNPGQFGAGVMFDWSVNIDIPVLAVLQVTNNPMTSGGVMNVVSADAPATAYNRFVTGPNAGLDTTTGTSGTLVATYNATSTSPDGRPGTAMINGPFPGQTPAFGGTMTPVGAVPVPAAVWLFGSGLIGLVGVARRRKA